MIIYVYMWLCVQNNETAQKRAVFSPQKEQKKSSPAMSKMVFTSIGMCLNQQ